MTPGDGSSATVVGAGSVVLFSSQSASHRWCAVKAYCLIGFCFTLGFALQHALSSTSGVVLQMY